jgi:hypothetical protein
MPLHYGFGEEPFGIYPFGDVPGIVGIHAGASRMLQELLYTNTPISANPVSMEIARQALIAMDTTDKGSAILGQVVGVLQFYLIKILEGGTPASSYEKELARMALRMITTEAYW